MVEDREARLREMREELSNFKALIENIGWKKLMVVADGQLKTRLPSILEKNENLLTITGKEFEKGEMAGITLFTQLPGIAIEGLQTEIEALEEQIENESGTRKPDNGSGDGDTFVGDAPNV